MLKKLLLAALWLPLMAHAQSYPSPTYNNVTVQGTLTGKVNSTGSTITNATITGGTISGLSSPLPVASGGTNSASASGTALDNITGFAGTGFMSRTGAGAYSFTASTGSGNVVQATSPTIASPTITGALTATGLVTTADLATQAANTVVANVTGSSASPTAFAMPSCSTSSSALNYTSGTGWGCNTSINAATLGSATFAAPGPIGSTTASTGAFTTLTANTPAAGNNNTSVATTAFVAAHAPCPSILDNGGDNTNTTDNSTAFANTVALGPTGQKCVYFPPGSYKFNSNTTYTVPSGSSLTIVGAGPDVSKLVWPSLTNGFILTLADSTSSIHIRDLSLLTTNVSNGVGTAITLNQGTASIPNPANTALSDITNVTLRGADGYEQTNYWIDGVDVNSVSNINFTNMSVVGPSAINTYGVNLNGTSTAIGVVYNFEGCTFNLTNNGITYGSYIQGVTVKQSNFTGGKYGIYVGASGTLLSQLVVSGSQFNNTIVGINEATNVPGTQLIGNTFIAQVNNAIGYNNQANPGIYSIVNNVFSKSGSPTGTSGIVLNGSSAAGIITGNMFYGLATAIDLQASSAGVNVQSNAYTGNTANVTNSGTGNGVGGGSQ